VAVLTSKHRAVFELGCREPWAGGAPEGMARVILVAEEKRVEREGGRGGTGGGINSREGGGVPKQAPPRSRGNVEKRYGGDTCQHINEKPWTCVNVSAEVWSPVADSSAWPLPCHTCPWGPGHGENCTCFTLQPSARDGGRRSGCERGPKDCVKMLTPGGFPARTYSMSVGKLRAKGKRNITRREQEKRRERKRRVTDSESGNLMVCEGEI
ncbi:hypothetical protein BaRGS_00032473, partial [Batillaria attramentaria]